MSIITKTQNQINEDLLANISDDYEKSIGYLTGDLVKSEAIELAKVYEAIQQLINSVDVDQLTSDELTKYVLQRKGIVRKAATYSQVLLTATGTGTITKGDLFATSNNTQFESTETKDIIETGTISTKAVRSGAGGNVGANTIVSMPITISGITGVTNTAPSVNGFEAESDNSLRGRYYEALQKPSTSGNIFHYLEWAKSVTGIGDAKIIPLWNGANTVKVVIVDATMKPAGQALIDAVQNYIDPKGESNITWGTGKGQAPIGAYTTVISAIGVPVKVGVKVIKSIGADDNIIKALIAEKITDYFKSIAFDDNHMFVSYAKVGALVLEVEGVEDYSVLKLNDTTTNVPVANEQVAVLDAVELL